MKNVLYAYMAGFVDADGSISIGSVGKQRQCVSKLVVTNCNEKVVQLFQKEFGGQVRCRVWENKKWKPNYEWRLTAVKAQSVIKLLLPYLRIKKKQALLTLRLGKLKAKYNGATRRWNPELSEKCNRVYSKIKDRCQLLNRRGVPQAVLLVDAPVLLAVVQ